MRLTVCDIKGPYCDHIGLYSSADIHKASLFLAFSLMLHIVSLIK